MASENEDKRETLADIVSEIRAYGDRPPPKCAWLEIADRIEAAWKRDAAEIEVNAAPLPAVLLTTKAKIVNGGNAAAMREALEMARDALKSAEKYVYGDPPDGGAIGWDDVWPSEWHNALEAVERALSAPARNCDLYANAAEAIKAQDVAFNEDNFQHGECRLGCPGCDDGMIDCKILWLFATAAERKGEGNAK